MLDKNQRILNYILKFNINTFYSTKFINFLDSVEPSVELL